MADNRPIGVFDSGIGGLTVLREIIDRIPGESTVYFGDNGRTPYGTKSHSTIVKYSLQDMRFLESHDVKMIVIACSTASAHAYKALKRVSKVPVVEMIYPSSEAAVEATGNGRIGIIATNATVSGGTYKDAIDEIRGGRDIQVIQNACPMFVQLAEEGWWDDEIAHLTARRYLKPLIDFGVDTVVLGCTHFPLLSNTIRDVMGSDIKLINSGVCVSAVIDRILDDRDMRNNSGTVTREFYTSDDEEKFEAVAAPFLGRGLPKGTARVSVDGFDVTSLM